MHLAHVGLTKKWQKAHQKSGWAHLSLGRVQTQFNQIFTVITNDGLIQAEVAGKLKHKARQSAELPAVGDWVCLELAEGNAIIVGMLPRKSLIQRQSVGRFAQAQAVAANVDVAFVVSSPDHDFNFNRLERYIATIASGGVTPVIVLNKLDMLPPNEQADLRKQLAQRFSLLSVHCTSTVSGEGITLWLDTFEPGKTYSLVGSSGVGKSSLLNAIDTSLGLATAAISDATAKGRHTTTHRALFCLSNGSIVIDTPGMRELGVVALDKAGLEEGFPDIVRLAANCKFSDCGHHSEPGCAVRDAISAGDIPNARYENYCKLLAEAERFATQQSRRKEGARPERSKASDIKEQHLP